MPTTREQRMVNLKRANTIRVARAATKRELAAGDIDFREALDRDTSEGMPLYRLMSALRGLGEEKIWTLLDRADRISRVMVTPTRECGALTEREKDGICLAVAWWIERRNGRRKVMAK